MMEKVFFFYYYRYIQNYSELEMRYHFHAEMFSIHTFVFLTHQKHTFNLPDF